MAPDELDGVFRGGTVGQIPDGDARGTAIFFPGSSVEPTIEHWVRELAWQGKVFRAGARELKNKILPFGIRAITADVSWDASWFDGEPCIVLDYSKRSLVARYIRDEIRRVGSGTYLGLVYWGKTRLLYFTLEFPT